MTSSLRSPFLDLPGAVTMKVQALRGAAHYGRLISEQGPLWSGNAITDFSGCTIIRVDGPDRLTWLDALTTQKLRELKAGESAESLILDPQGRIEHQFAVFEDGTATWLICSHNRGDALVEWLRRMVFMRQVTITDVSDEYQPVVDIVRPEASNHPDRSAAAPNGVPLIWHDPWHALQPGGTSYTEAPDEHPAQGIMFRAHLCTPDAMRELADRARRGELMVSGMMAADALRVAMWRPLIDREGDARVIPHELDLLRSAVHLDKGCYRGQETVAKVHNLGHPPRRLVSLDLDGGHGALPERGTPLWVLGDADRKMVGRLTSVARHWEEGPIALALVKRTLPADALLETEAEGIPISAAQRIIVRPDAGAAAGVPRLPRLPRLPKP